MNHIAETCFESPVPLNVSLRWDTLFPTYLGGSRQSSEYFTVRLLRKWSIFFWFKWLAFTLNSVNVLGFFAKSKV